MPEPEIMAILLGNGIVASIMWYKLGRVEAKLDAYIKYHASFAPQ